MELSLEQAVTNLVATYEGLKATRQLRMTRVEAMRKYTFAAKSFLTNPLTGGENLYSGIYDRTGAQAATEFAANLFTHTTPSDQQWLLLSPPAAEPQLAEDRGYGRSLADLASRFQRAAAETNFGTELHAAYEDLADGICCLDVAKPAGIGAEAKKAFVLTAPAMNEFCFLTDSSGRAHMIFSECAYTPYEAAKRFGQEKLPRALQEALAHLEASAYSQTQPFLNIMRPNEAWDPTSIAEARYPYESLWIDLKTKELLQRGGLRRLRRVIARFRAARGQPWGWGPTDVAYAWIRALDKSTEIILKYGAMKMNPPSIWPDDGAFYPQDAAPGTVIVGRLGATDRGTPSFLEVQGDHRVAQWLFDRMEALVMRAYMADIFTIFRDNKERTAREVATILQKSYDIIVPPLLRMKQELFAPLVLVCLELLLESELGIDGWMYAGKALPDLRYDLELISPLFLAMRWGELQRLDDLVTLNSRLAEIDPSVWDNYTLDEMSRGIGDAMGVPQAWKRPDSAVRQIREARERLLAQQRALEQTKLAGDAARGLGKGVEENSPLARMAPAA
jgi:hypothetical protein